MSLLDTLKEEQDASRGRHFQAKFDALVASDTQKAAFDDMLLRGRLVTQLEKAEKLFTMGEPHRVDYTNYRGERAVRTITPRYFFVGSTEWHPETQVFLRAHDHEKEADRDFAVKDFHFDD